VNKSGQVDKQAKKFHSGKRLRVARDFKSLRNIDLSEEFRVKEDTVKHWMGNKRKVPKYKIMAVAKFFEVPEELFSDDIQISEQEFKRRLLEMDSGKTDSPGPIQEVLPESGLPYDNKELPWEEVISGAGDEGEFHFYSGCKCNAEGNFGQAIFNLDKALNAGTLDGQLLFDAYYARGYSWYKKNDLKKALTDYVESLAPESINAPIPPAYDKALNRPYKRPRFPWYGEDLPLEKINDLDAIVEDIPTRATLYYIWVIESMDMDEYDSAIDDINKAITLDPQSVHTADFLGAKGYAFFQKGRYQEAVGIFSLAIDKDLNHGPEILYFRALAYEKLNQLNDSVQDIEKCLQFDPNNELFLGKYRALEENNQRIKKLNPTFAL